MQTSVNSKYENTAGDRRTQGLCRLTMVRVFIFLKVFLKYCLLKHKYLAPIGNPFRLNKV